MAFQCIANVHSLCAKKNFFQWVNEESPDILCIQETKLQENNLDINLKNIDGYNSYFSFAEKKGYSGVAIYTKIKPISVEHGIGINIFDNDKSE